MCGISFKKFNMKRSIILCVLIALFFCTNPIQSGRIFHNRETASSTLPHEHKDSEPKSSEMDNYFEIIEERYEIPLPPCGDECSLEYDSFELQEAGLVMRSVNGNGNGAGTGGAGKADKKSKTLEDTPMQPPPEFSTAPPILKPKGKTFCRDKEEGKSGLQSPIPLGRQFKWNTNNEGTKATIDLPNVGQRIKGNKYYGRISDRFFMENDGYNLNFYLNETSKTSQMSMMANDWEDEYIFAKGILHWGENDEVGSEHTMHGSKYPLEIEFVHYKKSLGTLENAEEEYHGVMIASVLYEFSGFDKDYFDPILKQAASIAEPGKIKQVHGPLYISALFPGSLEHYEYTGSYSNAPCGKEIKRIVFVEREGVGRDQLRMLRMVIKNVNGTTMSNNYRSMQEVNGREIIFNPTYGELLIENRDWFSEPIKKTHWD